MPNYKNKQWAGANGDWIATVGECKWELVNVYTLRKIPLPAEPFEATKCLDRFLYDDYCTILLKIAIYKVLTDAGRCQDFSLVGLFDDAVAILYGGDNEWTVFPAESLAYYGYSNAIIHKGLVFATTEIGTVYAWDPLHPGNYSSIYNVLALFSALLMDVS